MSTFQVLSFSVLLSLCVAEPPVRGNFGGYNYPAPTFSAPSTSYGTPSSNYGAPSSQYNAPNHYNTPSNQYNVPSTSYGAPSNNYHAPSNSFQNNNYKAPSSNYGAPSQGYNDYSSPSSSGYDSHDDHHHDEEYNEPKSYEFVYAVKDPYTGNDYDRKEMSDGNTVRGEYRVQLPDGRTQIVTYHADWKTGFHADVKYEGEAKYPETSGYQGPKNQFGSYPSSAYAAPNNNQYNQVSNQYGPPSSDYTSYDSNNKYDSYSSNGYASPSPAPTYGTPAFH